MSRPSRIALVLIACLGLASLAHAADDSSRISANPDFAEGLRGWQIQGDVHVGAAPGNAAKHTVTLGPGAASIVQHVAAGGANHMMIEATLHAVPAGLATVSVRCLDKDGRELMTLRSPTDIRPGKEADTLADYFRPHPLTASVEISVAKDDTSATV
ncbi:MAG TPA: hypothetical protein VHE33_14445, partial [Acidobacteriaceae bacterium]|nr:hypothetical protein [Acidobacteriaceae bacterium]